MVGTRCKVEGFRLQRQSGKALEQGGSLLSGEIHLIDHPHEAAALLPEHLHHGTTGAPFVTGEWAIFQQPRGGLPLAISSTLHHGGECFFAGDLNGHRARR